MYYQLRKEKDPGSQPPQKRTSKRALTQEETQNVLDLLHSERFVDKAPYEVYATLLDEGQYHCSVRTMYRILQHEDELRERRNQLRHPEYKKPELIATAANQVWSWDITRLLGPFKWTYYYLYVIIDIFSRYVVGWMVATRECAELARQLIQQAILRQGIQQNQLIIHSDRGSPMTSKTVAMLLADLGVTKSFSRPHTSNDNPFSEAQFKTLKYRPDFPQRFGSIEDSRIFCQNFFSWYNEHHYHSGIGFYTPAMVHFGEVQQVYDFRQQVLLDAYAAHPERFVNGIPKPHPIPYEVWINKPASSTGEAPH